MFARPGLPSFDYVRPATPDEAVRLLQEYGPAARPLMGGTDLLANMRDGKLRPQVVVDVKGLPGMRDIVYDSQAGLTVGAAVTMNELAHHPAVLAHYPLLAQAAETVASYQIRNRATIGGNLCNASPCADTSPATLVLDAEFVLYGPGASMSYVRVAAAHPSERTVPACEFFRGPGQTVLRPGELMMAVRFPLPPGKAAARYHKLGRCRSGDLALVGVAVLGYANGAAAGHNPSTGSGWQFCVGLGSVAPTPIRATEAEAYLAAHAPGEEAFARAAELAMDAAHPITDVRGTADYQKAMVRTLTLRGLREVWGRLREA
jgi:CO/xanthine dehydrogenase FAD-binding subunit